MKTRRIISILLSVCMLLGIAGISASAATAAEGAGAADLTIAATSNIGASATETIDSTTGQVTVTYYVNCATADLMNAQWTLTYDSEYLTFDTTNGANLSYNDNDIDDVNEYFMMPFANGDGVFNFGRTNEVIGNLTSLGKYKLSSNGSKVEFVSIKFKPKKAGNTTVNLDVEVSQVVKNGATDESDFIMNSEIVDNTVALGASAAITTDSRVDPALTFAGANMTFANNLAINFYINQSLKDNYSDFRIVCTRVGLQGADERNIDTYAAVTISGRAVYRFDYEGLNPQLLGDEITTVLYAKSKADGKEYCSDPLVYNGKTYAYNQLRKSGQTAKYKTLLVDLLNYCAAAQIERGYKTNALVNADLTTAEAACGTQTVRSFNDISNKIDKSDKTVNFLGANVVMGSSISELVYFQTTLDLSTITIKISVGNRENVASYTAADFEVYNAANNQYTLLCDKIFANELSDKITAKAYDKNGNLISNTIEYSIESYVARTLPKTGQKAEFLELLKAMMKYGDSVMAYTGKTAPVV